MRPCIGITTAAALLALFPVPAPALEPEVRDKAGFFSADAVSSANDVIRQIKRDQKKDLLIETFPRPPAGKENEATSNDRKEKDDFFAEWALQRAREEEVNGIYVLICKAPPYVKVAVGKETHRVFSDEDRDRLGDILVSAFKEKKYDDGLLEGVRFVRKTLSQREPAEPESPRPEPPPPSGPQPDTLPPGSLPGGVGCGGLGCGSLLCIGLVLLVVVVGGFLVLRMVTRSFRGRGGYGPGGYGPGGSGPPGYGPPGYGPPGYGGRGGGFLPNILGGMFGGAAGSWIYDRFFGRRPPSAMPPPQQPQQPPPTDYTPPPAPPDTGYTAGGGGDFGGGGDAGGGGDFGGGGGDAGGGGDFGGGGGDAGGGGAF